MGLMLLRELIKMIAAGQMLDMFVLSRPILTAIIPTPLLVQHLH